MKRAPRIVIVVAAVLAVTAAGGFVATYDRRQAIDWTLLGTEQNGRVLVIGFASNYSACTYAAKAEVDSQEPRSEASTARYGGVDLSVTAKVSSCHGREAAANLSPLRVVLDRPLMGRVVRGEAKSQRRLLASSIRYWNIKAPNVIGLTPGDAQGVAAAFNLRLKELGPSSTRGYFSITAQRRIGDVLEVETHVSRRK